MTPNDILLYSWISALLSHHQRGFLLQQMRRHRDPQSDNVQRARDLRALSPKWDVSVKTFPSELTERCGKGGRKSLRARQDKGHQGNKVLYINSVNARLDSQRLEQHAQDLHRLFGCIFGF